jgi:hypothetical protein
MEVCISVQSYNQFEEPEILQRKIFAKYIPTLPHSLHNLPAMTIEHLNSVFITGLAHKYPLYSQTKEDFAALVNTLVPEHVSSPG